MRRLSARISSLSVWSACFEGHSSIVKFLRSYWQIVTKGDFTARSWRNVVGQVLESHAARTADWGEELTPSSASSREQAELLARYQSSFDDEQVSTQQCCGSASPWCGSGCGYGFLFDADAGPDPDPGCQNDSDPGSPIPPPPPGGPPYWGGEKGGGRGRGVKS
jgi:hypothetical protein